MPWSTGVLQFCTLLSVTLCESICISSLVLLWLIKNSFPFWLSIRLFCYVHFFPIFCSKIVLFPCHPVVSMSSCILPLHASRIFFVVLECSVLSALFDLVSISLLLSFFFQQLLVYSLSCIVCFTIVTFFSFRHNVFQRSSTVLSFSLLVLDFFSAFWIKIPSRFWVSVRVL